jgi:hypothetical protein
MVLEDPHACGGEFELLCLSAIAWAFFAGAIDWCYACPPTRVQDASVQLPLKRAFASACSASSHN